MKVLLKVSETEKDVFLVFSPNLKALTFYQYFKTFLTPFKRISQYIKMLKTFT